MHKDAHSYTKIIVAIGESAVIASNSRNFNSVFHLLEQYRSVREALKPHLKDNIVRIPEVRFNPPRDGFIGNSTKSDLLMRLVSSCKISQAYLQSIGSDHDKELRAKEKELTDRENRLNLREKELEVKEKRVESLEQNFSTGIKTIKQLHEALRSSVVAETEKSHRKIEKYSNPRKVKATPEENSQHVDSVAS